MAGIKVCLLDATNNTKTTIPFSNGAIHLDDSIGTIKNKILRELGIDAVSYKELYLFATFRETLPLFKIYNQVTNNDEIPLTRDNLLRILNNVVLTTAITQKETDTYTYEDVAGSYKNEPLRKSIGREYKKNINPLFAVNPFTCDSDTGRDVFYSLDNTTLLTSGKIADDTIYVCIAEDVFEYSRTKGIDSEFMSEMYFPFLFASGIKSGPELLAKKQELIAETRRVMTDDTWKLYETVDMFHDIYKKRKPNSDLPYESSGIRSFDIGIKTDLNNVLPLDSMFKHLHATTDIPYIKYNPGFRRENLYRLYSEHISTKNRRIPFLQPQEIIRLSKETGKSSEISLYSRVKFKASDVELYIDFQKDGSVRVHTKLNIPISVIELHELLETGLNPVIDNINGFIEQIGYRIQRYTNLYDTFIDIINIEYGYNVRLTHPIKLDTYRKCISSIFAVENTDVTHKVGDKLIGAKLRFKRVDNYQEMDEIDEYISTEKGKYGDINGLITAMITEFNISEEIARTRMLDYFKKYAKDIGASAIVGDSLMMIVACLISSFMANFSLNANVITSIVSVYLIPYFIYQSV